MSSKLRRTLPAGLLTFLAVAMTGAALSWACTPGADISVTPGSGPSQATVQVTGVSYLPDAVVAIRWNGTSGPVLATAQVSPRGTFSTSVTIPAGAPDTYSIVGVAGQFIGTAAYTIEDPPQTTPGTGTGDGSSSGTTTGGPAGETGRSGANGVVSGGGGSRAADGEGAAAPSGGGSSVPAPSRRTGVLEADSGEAVFADSAARGARGTKGTPSARSGAADLWAGFDPSASRLLGGASSSPATGGSMPALPLALLALGLVAAMGGLGLAGARSRARRARSGASSD